MFFQFQSQLIVNSKCSVYSDTKLNDLNLWCTYACIRIIIWVRTNLEFESLCEWIRSKSSNWHIKHRVFVTCCFTSTSPIFIQHLCVISAWGWNTSCQSPFTTVGQANAQACIQLWYSFRLVDINRLNFRQNLRQDPTALFSQPLQSMFIYWVELSTCCLLLLVMELFLFCLKREEK